MRKAHAVSRNPTNVSNVRTAIDTQQAWWQHCRADRLNILACVAYYACPVRVGGAIAPGDSPIAGAIGGYGPARTANGLKAPLRNHSVCRSSTPRSDCPTV